ncbi:DUF1508 domain-containing protein [Halomicrobium urmianum]|uniref:DUF1508 domain-containing protein n=1 Tax=Halomicrobium urmianum TaxID=1586233 RepID=UPI001CD91BD5|nr:DUF1508 domain-containing protein [Halomicrobium urmianum]
MATETGTREGAYDGRLFELYTKYVSEPESRKDVYGYTLLVVGYVLAIGGMLVYLLGPTGAEVQQSTLFLVREVAAVPSALGLAFSLLGIVLLLPVTRRSLLGAVVGAIVSVAAVGLFVWYYPNHWHVGTPAYSGMIIALYTAGIALVAGVVIMVPVITGERSYFSETTEGHEYEHPEIMIGDADRGGLFTLFKRGQGWSWRFIDQSAVAASRTDFFSRLEAEESVEAVKDGIADAGLLEIKNAAFRLYESGDGAWQWYLMRDDGTAVAEGGSDFGSRDDADASINLVKDHGPDADTVVLDEATYDCYRTNGEWGWHLVDEDRNRLAVGTETHTDRADATTGLETFRDLSGDATDLVVESYGVELLADDDRWHWRMRDSAHRRVAASVPDYESKGVAENAVYDLLERLEAASVLDGDQPTYDVYQSGSNWAWRLVDENGRPVARGRDEMGAAEPATQAARTMRSLAGDADVVEIEDMEFETYRTADGWRWRLVTADREVHAESTDTYESEEAASRVVDRVREEAPDADLIEFDTAAFQVYEAEDGAWRWRLIDEDGNVMADSGQGEYDSKTDAMSAMTTLQENAPDAEHLEIETAAFEIFQDDRGWGWRLVDDIGDTIADGATRHDSEEGARQAMESLVDSVGDVDERRMADGIFQVYADDDDEWWWQFVRPNGTVHAEAARSFGTRHEVESAVEDVKPAAASAPVETIGRLAVLLDPEDWSWELVDEDRDRVAVGTVTYDDRDAAVDAVTDLQRHAADTTVYEIRDAAFDCYRSDDGWTWRLIDDDHDAIARAPETYGDLAAVEDAIDAVARAAPDAEFVDYDDAAFELYDDEDGWTWRLVDEDRAVIAAAASHYEDRQAAEDDLDEVHEEITGASVIEIDSAAFEFHNTDDGWRWRLVDEQGNELGESVETFETRAEAQEQLQTVKDLGPDAWVSIAE